MSRQPSSGSAVAEYCNPNGSNSAVGLSTADSNTPASAAAPAAATAGITRLLSRCESSVRDMNNAGFTHDEMVGELVRQLGRTATDQERAEISQRLASKLG